MIQELKSHFIKPENIELTVLKVAERIKQEGDKPHASVDKQIELLLELSKFDFGRFLLQNQGLNGYWTHYVLTHPRTSKASNVQQSLSWLEDFLLNKAPTMVATQQRFKIFLQENQKVLKNGAKMASIPSGMLGELLYLDFYDIDDIELVGIDYDKATLIEAQRLAEKQNLKGYVKLQHKDAWQLNIHNEFDLISSNGLNIYEPDDAEIVKLYTQFYNALKPGGKLVTSFLTFPPNLTSECEWDMTKINQDDLLLQKNIFIDVINSKWQCYRSTEQTKRQLEAAGFESIDFIYDDAKMFPTVVASR